MTLLQILFITSGFIILILGLDIARKQKFNALHFIVFIGVGLGLLVFTFFPTTLDIVGKLFGLQRGADALVYSSIIFLLYFVLLLLSKVEKNSENITGLVREVAISQVYKKELNQEIGFIIRVYNEEKVVKKTITNLLDKGYKDIIVVNDGSTDNSYNILKEIEGITLLNHKINRGAGAALETGFEYVRRYSKNKYICTFDADGQHDIKDLENFLIEFKKDKTLEVVLGSRFIKKAKTNVGLSRKIILKLGIIFTFFLSHIKLTDSHNGYRVFKRQTLDKFNLTIDDMSYASELVDIISTKKIYFREVPVNIRYTKYSMSKGQSSLNAINIALKMIWNKFFR